MKLLVLSLLDTDPLMRRIAVAWPAIEHAKGSGVPNWSRWSEASGVPEPLVRLKAPALFANGICLEDGTLHRKADEFLRRGVAVVIVREPKSGPRQGMRKKGGHDAE